VRCCVIPDEKLTIRQKMPRGEDDYKVFSIRIRKDTVEEIEEIAAKTRRSRNELIGTLLKFALQIYEIELDA